MTGLGLQWERVAAVLPELRPELGSSVDPGSGRGCVRALGRLLWENRRDPPDRLRSALEASMMWTARRHQRETIRLSAVLIVLVEEILEEIEVVRRADGRADVG